jgi:hypothetical protein
MCILITDHTYNCDGRYENNYIFLLGNLLEEVKIGTSFCLALQHFVRLDLLDNSLPTLPVSCLHPPSCHFKILRSCSTSTSHFKFGLPFFVLPSSRENVNFLQSKLSSILLICSSYLSLFIIIIDCITFGSTASVV